jgi:chemotaxis protein MotB
MTFADLMSLLMVFFVLLFSFSELDKQKYKLMSGSMKEAFGVQRDVTAKESPKGVSIIAREFSPARPEPTVLNQVRQFTTRDFLRNLDTSGQGSLQGGRDKDGARYQNRRFTQREMGNLRKWRPGSDHEQDDQSLAQERERDRKVILDALSEEIENGMIELEVQDRRLILRIKEKSSFPSGKADLMDQFKPVLVKMGKAISVTKGMIAVSGHTDDRPISTSRFRSNWELASSRAVTVLHELILTSGLPADRFQVQGYADTRPVDSNEIAEGRARNRRVEVTLIYGEDRESTEGVDVLGEQARAEPDTP